LCGPPFYGGLFHTSVGLAVWVNASIVTAILAKVMAIQWVKALGRDGKDTRFWPCATGFDVDHDVCHTGSIADVLVNC